MDVAGIIEKLSNNLFCTNIMIKKNIIPVISICLFLLIGNASAGSIEKQFKSPDGRFIAYVLPSQHSGESKIIIETNKGKILCSKDYGSEDGEHGFDIVQALWTPNSQYFVYSMSNSGGHQPWHFPIDFISNADCQVHNVDNYIGPIMKPSFQLKKPDIIKATKQKDILEEQTFETSLSELLKEKKK
jgi:hypothetical protein